jgi:hypothetical protein
MRAAPGLAVAAARPIAALRRIDMRIALVIGPGSRRMVNGALTSDRPQGCSGNRGAAASAYFARAFRFPSPRAQRGGEGLGVGGWFSKCPRRQVRRKVPPTRLALMSIVKPESAPVFPATICARWSSMRMIVQGWERSLETSVIKL